MHWWSIKTNVNCSKMASIEVLLFFVFLIWKWNYLKKSHAKVSAKTFKNNYWITDKLGWKYESGFQNLYRVVQKKVNDVI